MDELTRAVYRIGCLIAATVNDASDGGLTSFEILVEDAEKLYELFAPEEPDSRIATGVLTQHPDGDEFLERMRSEATVGKKAREDEKVARAVAMVDEDSMEHEDSEQELGTKVRRSDHG